MTRMIWLMTAAVLWATQAHAVTWGSCNAIETQSTCLDYSGTYWHGNVQAMKLHCQGAKVFYSRHSCETGSPFGDHRFGSCIYNRFQPFEFITHFYTLGGGGFDDPAYDFNISKTVCERSGGIWNWGPRSGRQAGN